MKKKFDAVRTMREIRDKLNIQFKGMTFEEQKRYLQERTRLQTMAGREQEKRRAA